MPHPAPLGARPGSMLARLMAGVAEHAPDASALGPLPPEAPAPDEPGHPEYHRRQRIDFALKRWTAATPRRYRHATPTEPAVYTWITQAAAHFAHPEPDEDDDEAIDDAPILPSLLLTGPTGTGKALADSTELATPAGPRPIGSMQVGDTVFGGDGSACRVTGVYPQGTRSLWRMHLRDGRSVVCDTDHLWLVTTSSDRGYGVPPKVMSLAEMMRVGFTFANGSSRWRLPASGLVEYPATDLPVDPYTLGVLIGDGGLTRTTPDITTPDPEILNLIKLPNGVTPHARPKYRESKAVTYLLSGRRPRPNPLTVALRGLGLMGLRSSERFIPDAYLTASIQDRIALLSGLVDTDGYIKGTSVSVSTSSERLASGIQNLVWSLGGRATARRRETTHLPSWTVHLSLPDGMPCPARLTRRQAAWTPRKDGRNGFVAVTHVERVPDGSATCIAVDSPDHTYLTADYVRTHNTHQAYGALRAIAETGPRRRYALIATTTADMYGQLRPTGQIGAAEHYLNQLAEVPLLLLDDLGSAKASEWTEEITYRLINERYNACRPTLFTSNLPTSARDEHGRPLAPDLVATLGDRIVSRLAEMTTVIDLTGTDRRRATS